MRTSSVLLGGLAALAALVGFTGPGEGRAEACGGCFHPPAPPTEQVSTITDHRMILSISPQQTTLYDEIRYSGSPATFAWVLPFSGQIDVGLSSDVLFASLDALTQTQVQAPPLNCPAAPTCNSNQGFGSATNAAPPSEDHGAGGGVVVTKQQVVGPYETVQLHSTDPNALNAWLTAHNFAVPADVQPIISAYVTEHFDFLAMKLAPGQGIQSMRPVRVTTLGASPVLPLRMVAAGTGATVGITLWVVADGKYEPQNFASFHIDDADLVWDWASSSSNYKTLRQQREDALAGKGWEMESSTDINQGTLRNYVMNGGFTGFNGGGPVQQGAAADYAAVPPDSTGSGALTSEQVRDADLSTLFKGVGAQSGNMRVTRIRSDLVHTALSEDLLLTASQDQGILANVRKPIKENGEPLCPVYNSSCSQVGQVPRSQALKAAKETFSCDVAEASSSSMTELTLAGLAGVMGMVAIGRRRRRGAR